MPEYSAANIIWLIPALPLLGFLVNVLAAWAGKRLSKQAIGGLATGVVFVAFALSVWALLALLQLPGEGRRAYAGLLPGGVAAPWISVGGFQVTYTALVDPLSLLMCLIVTGVGGLIHLYATGYMADDKDFQRFFAYFNLFIFFMLMLVLGGSILLMFIGWEGVGLCSYLLISFWYEDIENVKAGNKAFIVNRIGDVAFALGIMTIFAQFGTLTFYTADKSGFLDLASSGHVGGGAALTVATATLIGLLLFGGACGKSAQFPLHFWLPDAMAGPTPVSALIHAATMVTAGVVMITRVSPIVVHSPTAMMVIACIGVFTAIFAASIALTQNDIKKVLAYSTVSQLGYMFLGCGVGAFSAGMFHVTTHAFFKALLFLGAGAVIYSMHHEQDMRKMGGLKDKIPITFWTMVCAWLAISGIPPLAGFWSKDEILGAASGYPTLGVLYYAVGLFTAFLTAFYMSRLMAKTFWTAPRYDAAALAGHGHGAHGTGDAHAAEPGHGHGADASGHAGEGTEQELGAAQPLGIKESPPLMTFPLMVLAVLSVIGGLIGIPWHNAFESYLEPAVAKGPELHELFPTVIGMAIGFAVGAAGIWLCWVAYKQHRETGEILTAEQRTHNPVYQGATHLWGVDGFFVWLGVQFGGGFGAFSAWIDRYVVDGLVRAVGLTVNMSSELFRRTQSGFVRHYALVMLAGVVLVVAGILWPVLHR